jgi:hypothetical protein
MYVSPITGRYYAFLNRDCVLNQYQLMDNGSGRVAVILVRTVTFSNQCNSSIRLSEGVTADDVHAKVYLSEELIGIWKLGAEPTDGSAKVMVDKPIAQGGHIQPDIEGLTIYYKSNGTGYLIGSTQGNSSFNVYTREGNNTYLGTFNIADGAIDGVNGTDGIDVTNFPLGPNFPYGFFIAQDGGNTDGNVARNHNFKLVPFQSIAGALGLTMDTSWDPRLVSGTNNPPSTFNISGSVEAAGVTLSYTDGVAKAVTSAGNGRYDLPVSYNWSGTIALSHPCFTFNPTSRSYSNVTASQVGQNYTAAFNSGSGCADVNVLIAGTNQGRLGIPNGASTRVGFAGVDNGPVKVDSINGINILTALRVIWKEPGVRTSYSEMMGLPTEQLSTEYWFPWYNNAAPNSMDQAFRIANVNASSAAIQVWVGSTLRDSFTLNPNTSIRVGYNIDNGPIKILCTDCTGSEKIIAAMRVIWREPAQRFSYSEMMGLPKEQLSDEYWFPWYNNVMPSSMDQGFRIANVSNTEANTVEVWVSNTKLDTRSLNPGASVRVGYNVDNGPIRILCTTCSNTGTDKIIAALRVIWKEPGFRASYSEMMGLPTEQLSTDYWFPWYNNAVPASMDQGFRIANVSPTEANTIEVWVGNTQLSAISLAAGASVRVGYHVDNGPIRIVCTTCTNTNYDQIIAALRVIWKELGYRSSYSEMMGLPAQALSTEYWFPWYNFAVVNSMDQGFRVAVP